MAQNLIQRLAKPLKTFTITLAELPAKRYIRGWFAAYLRGFETELLSAS